MRTCTLHHLIVIEAHESFLEPIRLNLSKSLELWTRGTILESCISGLICESPSSYIPDPYWKHNLTKRNSCKNAKRSRSTKILAWYPNLLLLVASSRASGISIPCHWRKRICTFNRSHIEVQCPKKISEEYLKTPWLGVKTLITHKVLNRWKWKNK